MDNSRVSTILQNESLNCLLDFISKYGFSKGILTQSSPVVIANIEEEKITEAINITAENVDRGDVSVESVEHASESQDSDVHENMSETGDFCGFHTLYTFLRLFWTHK